LTDEDLVAVSLLRITCVPNDGFDELVGSLIEFVGELGGPYSSLRDAFETFGVPDVGTLLFSSTLVSNEEFGPKVPSVPELGEVVGGP